MNILSHIILASFMSIIMFLILRHSLDLAIEWAHNKENNVYKTKNT